MCNNYSKMAKNQKNKTKLSKTTEILPLMTSEASVGKINTAFASNDNPVRRNASSTINRTDRYKNIEDGLIPFKYSSGIKNSSNMDIRDAVILCQKAYYNFAIFRNTIDLMTEFSSSNIYFQGGSQKSRDFFEALFKKINVWDLQDKFFREYYRSGNVFLYRFDALVKDEDVNKITQTFGLSSKASVRLPSRYIILNPADIQLGGGVNFSIGRYYKILSDYELERLKSPKTEEDLEVLKSLPPETRKLIEQKTMGTLSLPLERERLLAVFYKKQDYEPFAIPMGFPVLDDINWKSEMKKMDMAITRTMQQAILLVTMGTDPERGGVNQKNLEAMQKLFENQSVGRVLIADYTTKAEFVIPDIGNIIGPQKYEVVDKDIQIGLNNILIGSEKFANQTIKVQVFIERLKQARQAFINEFLIPEIRRISKDLGFKNFPTPNFEDIDLKDDIQYSRVYSRLIELGILTPEEGIKAIETGRLPNPDESAESQKKLKDLKNKGYYQPVIGGVKNQEAGRPSGSSGTPQQTKNVSPIGQGKNSKAAYEESYSLSKVKDNLVLAQKLEDELSNFLRKKHNIKRMSNEQKSIVDQISKIIISNEHPDNWIQSIEKYANEPIDKNSSMVSDIINISNNHQLNTYLASILYHSKI
ncbi:MAG: hypothetical protein EBU90_08320 [Proteobacteria bacterium]|nr:hypothetical protein [Pseudomonadota bacterium]